MTDGLTRLCSALQAEALFASWSSRGGWKENAIVMKMGRLCTTCSTYVPAAWRAVMKALRGSPDAGCPFPPVRPCPYVPTAARAGLGAPCM